MTVRVPDRNESSAQFTYTPYCMALEAIVDVEKASKKHQALLGDKFVSLCLELLKNCVNANSIYLTENTPVEIQMMRRKYLVQAKGYVNNIVIFSQIFFGALNRSKAMSFEEMAKQQDKYADMCDTELKLLDGLLKSDKRFMPKKV